MTDFLLDSNVFDELLDGAIPSDLVKRCGRVFVTNVQISELKNVPDRTRRSKLLALLDDLAPEKLHLHSGVWLDDLYWDDDQPWRDEIGPDCEHFVKGKTNLPWKDALIGEVAKHRGLTLVSKDRIFLRRAAAAQIPTMEAAEFISLARSNA